MSTGEKATNNAGAGVGGTAVTIRANQSNNAFAAAPGASPSTMNGGDRNLSYTTASQNLPQQYQGLLNSLSQQQAPVGGIFSQPQKNRQESQLGIGSPQILQLFSSLMGGGIVNDNNDNSSTPTTTNSSDLLLLAQQMGLLQQALPQQQQWQAVPSIIVQNQSSGTTSVNASHAPKIPSNPNFNTAASSFCRPVGQQPASKKAKKNVLTSSQPTRVPCRARGMDINHNFEVSEDECISQNVCYSCVAFCSHTIAQQSAYFTISEDMSHGTPLVCSYPACRDKGVKFLYCSYCKDTGAKRQFRERHNHGEDDETARRTSQTPQKSSGSAEEPIASTEMTLEKTSNVSSSDTSYSGNHNRGKRNRTAMDAAISDTSNTVEDMTIALLPGTSNKVGFSVDLDEPMMEKMKNVKGKRMSAWTALLLSRPQQNNDDEGMASWLMKVMAVSDVSRPIEQVLDWLQSNQMDIFSVSAQNVRCSETAASTGPSAMFSTEPGDFNDSSSSMTD
jgi:hypothetical protein